MVFGLFGGGAKTYEMPSNASITPGIFNKDAFARLAPSLEGHVAYVDATLVLGEESYLVRHVQKSDFGYKSWQAEVSGKSQDIDKVVKAVADTIGKRSESKQEDIEDNKVKITVALHPETDLRTILRAMNQYAAKADGAVFVSGYALDIPVRLADQLIAAGLPLQEVQKAK